MGTNALFHETLMKRRTLERIAVMLFGGGFMLSSLLLFFIKLDSFWYLGPHIVMPVLAFSTLIARALGSFRLKVVLSLGRAMLAILGILTVFIVMWSFIWGIELLPIYAIGVSMILLSFLPFRARKRAILGLCAVMASSLSPIVLLTILQVEALHGNLNPYVWGFDEGREGMIWAYLAMGTLSFITALTVQYLWSLDDSLITVSSGYRSGYGKEET